jgi:CDP-diacylglycerol--serine O-phosphatidyltransferase
MSAMPRPRVPHRLRRRAYLLPSLFTIANLGLGFLAIVDGLRGEFRTAALLIFAAGVMDFFDGRIARMTGTESDFGKEYDSLADVVTFGVAPALLAYLWGLESLGRIGWLGPLFFLVCCATRLARFNVQTKVVDSRFFVGLPTPAAAGAAASILYFAPDSSLRQGMAALLLVAMVALGALMVSTIRYKSNKMDLRRAWSYRAIVPLAAVVLVAIYNPHAFFLVAATLYTLSGPLAWLLGKLRRRGGEPQLAAAPPAFDDAPGPHDPEAPRPLPPSGPTDLA